MNKIKSPLGILISVLLISIVFLLIYTNANKPEETKSTNLSLSKENPLLKQMNITKKPQVKEAENKTEDTVETKKIVADLLKGEIHNEEFDAMLEIEVSDGNARRLYVEITPKQKELTAEEIYKKQGQFILNKVIIEQNLTDDLSIQENFNLTIPAKVFYSVDDVRKRIIANADFIYKKDLAVGILEINPDNSKAIEKENKIYFEKSENVGAKLTFKTTFDLIASTTAPTEEEIEKVD